MMTLWMFVAGLGALVLSLGLFGIAKSWFGTACAALTFICALALLVLASEEADRDRVERCKNMGVPGSHRQKGGHVMETAARPDVSHYTYRISWSAEDDEFVATCVEFPSLSWLASTQTDALQGLETLLRETLSDMEELD